MKVVAALLATAATASAFAPATFVTRSSFLSMSYDLDYGKKNDYVPANAGDGGQGQFGARSPNNWRVPGTSPVGQSSYAGAPDGGDEPWFAEAISTVHLDLNKAAETRKAFTKAAADFKLEEFAKNNNIGDAKGAMEKLIDDMGYDAFLESSQSQLKKAWDKLSGGGNKSNDNKKKESSDEE